MKKVKKMAFGGMSNKPMDPKMKAGLAGMQGSAQLGAMNKMLAGQNPGGRGLGNIASRPTGGQNPAMFQNPGARAVGDDLVNSSGKKIGAIGLAAPGPKPAPAGMSGFGMPSQEGLDFLRTRSPLDMSKTAGPGALDMTKTAGPGARPPGMKKGGKVSSASKRADGCAVKGKTKGKMV